MENRVRMVVLVSESCRKKVRVAAAQRGDDTDMGQIVEELVNQAYPDPEPVEDQPASKPKRK